MKPIPRIRGSMWPACVFLVLILLLPLMAFAQEDPGTGDVTDPGEVVEETTADDTGDVSVVEPEDDLGGNLLIYVPAEEEELLDLPQDMVEIVSWEDSNDFDYTFQKQAGFEVVDRPNDEGGGYSIKNGIEFYE